MKAALPDNEDCRLKNEFVSTVSHELRTPLTSISAALRMILINDLLDMEKLLAGKMTFDLQPHSLTALIKQAISENQVYADQYSVQFFLNTTDDYVIAVDAQRLQQVLSNFLSNAAKFSNQGERVDISLTLDQGRARISVQDYGVGISVDFQKRIFQKFLQADSSDARRRGGTGLGLSISKELVERMGGAIGFSSELNHGSIFFAEFPLLTYEGSNV